MLHTAHDARQVAISRCKILVSKSSHGMEIHPHWVWISPRWPCVVFGCPPYRSHRDWVQSQVSRIGLREAKAPPVRVFHALRPKEVAKRTATTVSKSTSKSKWTDKYNREQHLNTTHMTLSFSRMRLRPLGLGLEVWSHLEASWNRQGRPEAAGQNPRARPLGFPIVFWESEPQWAGILTISVGSTLTATFEKSNLQYAVFSHTSTSIHKVGPPPHIRRHLVTITLPM